MGQTSANSPQGGQGIVDSNTVLKARGADLINLYQLVRYIQESKLAYKVESYASYAEEQESTTANGSKPPTSTPVLHTLVSFLTSLTNLSTEGRIFYEKISSTPSDIKLSYLLLSPTHAFSSIASAARAVILAGGTMSPFDDYRAHLFPTLPPDKITTLSCGHVIPSSNLFVWTLASTKPIPPGSSTASDSFEFSFQKRSDRAMIRQLGLALLNICSVVPDGVVVFFPSYGYLDEVVASWQTPDNPASQGAPGTAGPATAAPTIWDRLAAKKALFRETKGGSSEDILQQYSAAILSPEPTSGPAQQQPPTSQKPKTGAVLLSVVGGKLSEGINFADRLGRCVIVVGLPYPNIHAPDWKARLEYVEATALSRLRDHTHTNTRAERPVQDQDQDQGQNPLPTPTREDREQAKQAAREFYENACMRAVNQSIGRVIRHRGDYAAVVLVDRRFGAERVRAKLPGWIRAGLPSAGEEARGLVGLMGGLGRFFRGRE
ncbi:uncharacterized protein THITE_2116525 [Thermothielavioides terrestris NRRL 8126]|uniref:ATP-dependent helicase C-terminal domain-containing protein n=1 Tax=Thermothielavioides terrestris (strain ATCC 38088 / NRRL 8126) TaxID=578455 RepID=G2R6F8_THETT|nr:uncharacterized protein THITE_2116525 [Thermothielavioides terrestris NRRL 8126]AEO67643.1 hypothetical protein THITE_2116525 [Thermothielavioides terrestris NRRL 8126]